MKYKITLALIVLLAVAIRFYNLGQNPPSLYWDEIALGYNAYSLAETGKDEEGAFLPLQYVRSFGDFKPPFYMYTAVPMIKLLGLNEWTTRFPSAFFGTLSVLLTYLVTKKILSRVTRNDNAQSEFLNPNRIEWIALLSALLMSISPWHTQISRVAYEANVAHFLVLFGVWLFLTALEIQKAKTIVFLLSGLSFVLTLYTFNSNRVFTPILVAVLGIIYIKEIATKQYRNIMPLIMAVCISVILLIPVMQHMLSSQGQLRYKEVNIFSDPNLIELSNQRIAAAGNTWWANILSNRRIIFAQQWLDGYFRHFSGKFLFISGDINPRFSLQDVGALYLIELPFLLIGLYLMLSRPNKEYATIIAWMLIAPIPAAFAREVPHGLRTLNMLPTLQIITALGFVYTVYKLQLTTTKLKVWAAPGLLLLSFILLVGQFYYFQHNYYTHYPQFAESEWQYGYKEMVNKVSELEKDYDKVVITEALGRPYINILFYKKYPPALFQQERQAVTDATGFGFISVYAFNKYQFKEVDWKREITATPSDQRALLVGTPAELKEDKFTKAVIRNLKGQIVFIISEVPKGQDALLELK